MEARQCASAVYHVAVACAGKNSQKSAQCLFYIVHLLVS